ncbi:hypothetical protein NDU88_007888 [Pleurodeles waltl]|uniref:Uncharacterized protein n=1 Tax=Pleurodeles waltl TaxID=8319 RepID=A0AAV7RT64_PLEWA|nr:hypothetical protein NDU88_007888 [Pleurodeles waltl]
MAGGMGQGTSGRSEIPEKGGCDRPGDPQLKLEAARPQELLSGGEVGPTRIEIQEDGTMALTHRDVTRGPTGMGTAVAEEANIDSTAFDCILARCAVYT